MTISLKRTILLLLPIAFHSVSPQSIRRDTPADTRMRSGVYTLDRHRHAGALPAVHAGGFGRLPGVLRCVITQTGETQSAAQSVIDGIVQDCNAEGHPINGITVTPITPTNAPNAPETATSAAAGPSDSASGPSPTGGAGSSTASAADSASTSSATGAPSARARPAQRALHLWWPQWPEPRGASIAPTRSTSRTGVHRGASGPSDRGSWIARCIPADSASTGATGVPSGSASGRARQ
ncbi:hypothetical protein B0H13DRAFT_2297245 [Mycena leptocephala]|nr:hypothetical protein B0H13DRAFT_2297245 [Mycena leptocephala]